jgi:hypothetical protein
MTEDEEKLFSTLMFDHKHLWIALQETKHLNEFPDDDPYEVHVRFSEAAAEVYQPLADALLEGQPLKDTFETVLLSSTIALKEARKY